MRTSRVLAVAGLVVCIALAIFVVYGLKTDCAHTAGYVDCSAPETSAP